jgi:hypothetical protein
VRAINPAPDPDPDPLGDVTENDQEQDHDQALESDDSIKQLIKRVNPAVDA